MRPVCVDTYVLCKLYIYTSFVTIHTWSLDTYPYVRWYIRQYGDEFCIVKNTQKNSKNRVNGKKTA